MAQVENQAEESERSVDIYLLDLLLAVLKQKIFILKVMVFSVIVALCVVLLLPNRYIGVTTIMPPQQDQSAAASVFGQIVGGGSALGGGSIAGALGLKNPNDLYVGILRSRSVADSLIQRFSFGYLYDTRTLVDTRDELADNTTITAGKDGLIKIEFEDIDARRAAAVANAYVTELENMTAHLAMSEALNRRKYFQEQVNQAKQSLQKADLALKSTQEKTGLIKPDEQAKAIFEASATLRGQILSKEVELRSVRSYATEKNPDVVRVHEELSALRKELAGLERDNKLGAGNILVPTGKIPEAGMEMLMRYRDVKYFETVYELLSRQLELARVDEGKNSTVIQVVDLAFVSDKKMKPKTSLIILLSAFFGGFLAVAFICIRDLALKSDQDGALRQRMLLLFQGMRF